MLEPITCLYSQKSNVLGANLAGPEHSFPRPCPFGVEQLVAEPAGDALAPYACLPLYSCRYPAANYAKMRLSYSTFWNSLSFFMLLYRFPCSRFWFLENLTSILASSALQDNRYVPLSRHYEICNFQVFRLMLLGNPYSISSNALVCQCI